MITRTLRSRLIFAPQLPSRAIRPFDGLPQFARLLELVRDYTPEIRDSVLRLSPGEAAKRFREAFSKRWFPLAINAYYLEGAAYIDRLAEYISAVHPADNNLHGYESFWSMNRAQLLAEVILRRPAGISGSRMAVMDRFTALAKIKNNEDVLSLAGALGEGLTFLTVARRMKGSHAYPGLLDACRVVWRCTGNPWLDDYSPIEGSGNIAWERPLVEKLTAALPECKEIMRRMLGFSVWLDHDFAGRSAEVIRFLTGGSDGK